MYVCFRFMYFLALIVVDRISRVFQPLLPQSPFVIAQVLVTLIALKEASSSAV